MCDVLSSVARCKGRGKIVFPTVPVLIEPINGPRDFWHPRTAELMAVGHYAQV